MRSVLDCADVGEQLLCESHTVCDVSWFADVKVQGEYGLGACFFDPTHEPTDRCANPASGRFIIHADQPRFGSDHGVSDLGDRKNLALLTDRRASL